MCIAKTPLLLVYGDLLYIPGETYIYIMSGRTESIKTNDVFLHGIVNTISPEHDVVFQRLDTLMKNNGQMVHYETESFRNTEDWVGIPVIYAKTNGATIEHPKREDVLSGNLPKGYSEVGTVTVAGIVNTGEPVLKGKINIYDLEVDGLTTQGKMSVSTGFTAGIENINGQHKLVGSVVPNHLLIFERGACPNCFPNDNSAWIENIVGGINYMDDDEAKGFFTKLVERLEGIKVADSAIDEVKDVTNTVDFDNVVKERDEMKAKLAEFENLAEQAKKDAEWAELKNMIPAGWMGEKEPETRKEFEAGNVAFTVKLMKFNNGITVKSAEGDSTGKKVDVGNAVEMEIENINKGLAKNYGFVITGGDEE